MNKPVPHPPSVDDDIGPLDEHGQQVLSPEEEAVLDRLDRDPAFLAAIAEADASIDAGHFFTHEQVVAESAERRRRYLAERKR